MKYYEAIYIAHPNLEDAGLTKLVEAPKGAINKRGGEIVYEEIMGKKRLAYPVEKQRFGTYVLIQFTSDGEKNVQLNQDLELMDNVLAQMIVSIDADDVYEEQPEHSAESHGDTIDTAGKTSDTKGVGEEVEKEVVEAAEKITENATEDVAEAVVAEVTEEVTEEV
ncbi:MAG: 30S ribosomal protein S6, partial [Gammaproteobacteria bacterium]